MAIQIGSVEHSSLCATHNNKNDKRASTQNAGTVHRLSPAPSDMIYRHTRVSYNRQHPSNSWYRLCQPVCHTTIAWVRLAHLCTIPRHWAVPRSLHPSANPLKGEPHQNMVAASIAAAPSISTQLDHVMTGKRQYIHTSTRNQKTASTVRIELQSLTRHVRLYQQGKYACTCRVLPGYICNLDSTAYSLCYSKVVCKIHVQQGKSCNDMTTYTTSNSPAWWSPFRALDPLHIPLDSYETAYIDIKHRAMQHQQGRQT